MPQSPKFLMRLINILLACASSDVSRKELQSCTKQKEVQIEIKMVPKRVPILHPNPKILTRLIHVIFACASSDVSQKELQSCNRCVQFLKIFITVPILPPSPKFLTRLIHALFACASSDVSQKELQSSTQQKEVQSYIKSAKVVPKKRLILPHIPKFLMRAILVFI